MLLQELFPLVDQSILSDIIKECGSVNEAVEKVLSMKCLLDSNRASVSSGAGPSGTSKIDGVLFCEADLIFPQSYSKEKLLCEYSSRLMNPLRSIDLFVNRDSLMRTALTFYKNCKLHPERLQCELIIEFENEEGIDAGALRFEFFENIFREINDAMFEGEEKRRVPKKDANMEQNFELVGMMIGHSILQGGPGFSCLCPPAFNYLLYGDKERALECLPSLEDIPQNTATVRIIDLISEVCKNVVCVILTSLFGFIEWDL